MWALARAKGGTGVTAQEIHDELRTKGSVTPIKDVRQTLARLITLRFVRSSGITFSLTGAGHKAAGFLDGLDPFGDHFKTSWAEDLVVKAVKDEGERTALTIAGDLGISQTATCAALKNAMKTGKVKMVGRGKAARYSKVVPIIPFSPNDQDLSDIATIEFKPKGETPENFTEDALITLDPEDWKSLRMLATLTKTPENILLSIFVKEGLNRWKEDTLKIFRQNTKPRTKRLIQERKSL